MDQMAAQTSTSHTPSKDSPTQDAHKDDGRNDEVISYEMSVYQAGLHSAKPPFTFQPSFWEPLAKDVLSANAWGYLHGNAGAGTSYQNNPSAFKHFSMMPRRTCQSLLNPRGQETLPDVSVTVFGEKLPFPVAMAPIGVQKIFDLEGESGAARGGASVGIPYILSTASSASIEEVSSAMDEVSPTARRWYQLYWPSRQHDDITISLLGRAKRAGYTVLFVTLDTYMLGWRPSDMDNGYNPFLHPDRIGVEIGLTDPAFRAHFKNEHGYGIEETNQQHHHHHTGTSSDKNKGGLGPAAREWAKIIFPGHPHTWDDIKFLKQHWDGPIVLKGIQDVEDAGKAKECGVQGIVFSNHGGRQMDGGLSSLATLPGIVRAVGDEMEIFFDSGIRCGADIIKALALGAKCVLVGRPYAYGLALGGGTVSRTFCGPCAETCS
ncbi:putative fmn dependent [Diplogelasinospora grovesii]|uniref:Fmn dependent n=1 Tax=Diplogelasinospora grovesii TaxID=303347 RepID=A0AAN6N6C2_9PEZI|nr:putative fmn dependent [Diplogelasinospora grovesii]